MSLFREEVLRRKTENLHGTINLALPMSWQVITSALVLLLALVAVFLGSASYSRTEIAVGTVVPEGGILDVIPARAGRVEAVNVVEGQLVRRGTGLARVRVEETDRAGTGAQAAILTAIELQGQSLNRQDQWAKAASLSEQAEYAAQLESLRSELNNIDSQITVQARLVAIGQTEFKQASDVAARGFISRRDLTLREEALLSAQQRMAALEQTRAAKIGALRQAEQARRQAGARASAAAAALASNRAQIDREAATERAEQGYSLVAPADGRVAALSLPAGDTVTGAIVMKIIPTSSRLIASIAVPAKAAGFVRPGQKIRMALDAYPSERFGTVAGVITAVSSAPTLRRDQAGNSAPVYLATASIANPRVRVYGRAEDLLPGMSFSARIVAEERSLLQWLFDPLYAAFGHD